jgi:hypothetical protein
MSAVAQRSKRATAGKRMSSLVGEALDNDETFWNHDTWAEEGDDADSFRESDEDSEVRKDAFDSDFNDSESDNEADEVKAGEEEERRLQRDEKMARRQKALDVARAGRELVGKKKGKIKGNRIFGDGINAGLVLKFPTSFAAVAVPAAGAAAILPPPAMLSATTTATIPPKPAAPLPYIKVPKVPKVTLASTRSRRDKNSLRTSTTAQATPTGKEGKAGRASPAASTTVKRKAQKRFTQEELLLEAATETEPENSRWLLARKRLHQQEEATRAALHTNTAHSKLLQRYVSKRGCFNTLNFSEMDAVPKILVPTDESKPKPVIATYCVITGERARYKDPKTNMGYYNAAAFKELRRRQDAGEPLQQEEKMKTEPKIEKKTEPKLAEVPSLEPEQLVLESTAPPASPNTTARALLTVQDPSRKLTMRTRNASKHGSDDTVSTSSSDMAPPPLPPVVVEQSPNNKRAAEKPASEKTPRKSRAKAASVKETTSVVPNVAPAMMSTVAPAAAVTSTSAPKADGTVPVNNGDNTTAPSAITEKKPTKSPAKASSIKEAPAGVPNVPAAVTSTAAPVPADVTSTFAPAAATSTSPPKVDGAVAENDTNGDKAAPTVIITEKKPRKSLAKVSTTKEAPGGVPNVAPPVTSTSAPESEGAASTAPAATFTSAPESEGASSTAPAATSTSAPESEGTASTAPTATSTSVPAVSSINATPVIPNVAPAATSTSAPAASSIKEAPGVPNAAPAASTDPVVTSTLTSAADGTVPENNGNKTASTAIITEKKPRKSPAKVSSIKKAAGVPDVPPVVASTDPAATSTSAPAEEGAASTLTPAAEGKVAAKSGTVVAETEMPQAVASNSPTKEAQETTRTDDDVQTSKAPNTKKRAATKKETATPPPKKSKKARMMSPNTLINTALEAYMKLQTKEE